MESRYLFVRRTLDELGYQQSFNLQSLQLVDILLKDLIRQSDQLKRCRHQLLLKDCLHSPPNLKQVYGSDDFVNSAKENKWQREIVQIKEDAEKDLKALNTRLMKLEFQIEDLNLLNSQYMLKVQWLEKESQLKSDKLQEMHEKSLQAAIQVTGSEKEFAFRHQHLVIASLVPPESDLQNAPNQSQVGSLRHNQPHPVDMFQVADELSARLKSEVDALKMVNEQAEELVSSLKTQLEVTKSENERLTRFTNDRHPCNKQLKLKLNDVDQVFDAPKKRKAELANIADDVDRPQRLSQDSDEESVDDDLEGRARSSSLSKQNPQLMLNLNDVDKDAQAPEKQRKEELANIADKELPKAKVDNDHRSKGPTVAKKARRQRSRRLRRQRERKKEKEQK